MNALEQKYVDRCNKGLPLMHPDWMTLIFADSSMKAETLCKFAVGEWEMHVHESMDEVTGRLSVIFIPNTGSFGRKEYPGDIYFVGLDGIFNEMRLIKHTFSCGSVHALYVPRAVFDENFWK